MSETLHTEQPEPVIKTELWDNSKRARTLIFVFEILIGITLIGLISDYFELELLARVKAGDIVDEGEAERNDRRQLIVGIFQTTAYIASMVVFIMWFRRAYGNLHRSGISHLKHSEPMALWTWFIPIISLFRPVQIMHEIWTETQDRIKKYDLSYVISDGSLFIGVWWALFIVSNFIGRYILKSVFKRDTLEQIIQTSQATMISDILEIPEALLVILIVYKLSKMETRLGEEVKSSGGNVVYK